MNESDVKRAISHSMKEHGSYSKRIEDQFAVGTYDMILIPKGLPVFMAEVKMVRGNKFGPSPRQMIELVRIENLNSPHVIPVVIGWRDKVYYFHAPAMIIRCEDCFSVTTSEMPFHNQLVQYYHSLKGKI